MVLDDMYARERFLFQLEWLLALENRYSNVLQSGLVHIAYAEADIRELTYGASDAARQLGEVMASLKQAFRSTDLIARDGLSFWILTPFTQTDPVMDKVQKVIRTAPQNSLGVAQHNVRVFLLRDHLTPDGPTFTDGKAFLTHLLSLKA
jgi:hypothetical protein